MRYVPDSCSKQGVFGVSEFNCVKKISLRPIPVTLVTKIWKFEQKISYNSAYKGDVSQLLQKQGVSGWEYLSV